MTLKHPDDLEQRFSILETEKCDAEEAAGDLRTALKAFEAAADALEGAIDDANSCPGLELVWAAHSEPDMVDILAEVRLLSASYTFEITETFEL